MRLVMVGSLVQAFLDGVKPLRTYFSRLAVTDQAKKGRTKVLQLVITVLLLFSLVVLEGMIAFNYFTYQTLGSLLDTPYLGMFLATLAAFLLLFLLGSIGLSSIIYSGKDIALVSTLPVTEVELLTSRLLIAYILYLPIYVALVLPAIVVASFVEGVGLLFVLGALCLLAFGPLLPLSLAAVVATALVRLSKGRRFKMVEQLFTFVVMLGFSLVMITVFSRNLEEGSSFQVDYQSMMLSFDSLFTALTRLFPLFVGQAKMVWSFSGLITQTLVILLCALVASLWIGRGYERSLSLVASAQSVTRRKKKNGSSKEMSPTLSLMVRELEVIKSHSVFMIEVVGELLLPLILLGVYALTGVLGEIEGMASMVASSPYLSYGIFLAVSLLSSISMLSSTSVSRQGPLFALDRVLPVKARVFVWAKLLVHLVLVGGTNLLYLVLALLFFKVPGAHLLWMAPLTLLTIFSIAAFGLAIDYKRPMLSWSIPQQAMKSNLNGLLGMLAALGVLALVGSALLVPQVLGAKPLIGIVLSALVLVGLVSLAWKAALTHASSTLSR